MAGAKAPLTMLKDLQGTHDAEGQRLGWIKTPYGLKLADDVNSVFHTLLEQEAFAVENDGDPRYVSDWMETLVEQQEKNQYNRSGVDTSGPLVEDKLNLPRRYSGLNARGDLFYSSPNYTDTRVGGNDAINPYWQFNIDDDIVPPILAIPGMNGGGMGRVYNEVYDSNQQILWLSMGVPEYTNLISFYLDAGSENAARIMNKGTLRGIVGTIINYAFKAVIWAFTFPVMAPFWVVRWMNRLVSDRITQYYYFRPTMVIYYEMVNTMLSYLAVGLGLYPQVFVRRHDSSKILTGGNTANASSVNTNVAAKYQPGGGVTPEQFKLAAQAKEAQLAAGATDKPNTNIKQQTVDVQVNNAQKSYQNQTVPAAELEQHVAAQTEDVNNSAGDFSYSSDADPYTEKLIKLAAASQLSDTGIPELLQYGPDIFSILNRRARLFKAGRVAMTTRQLMQATMAKEQGTAHTVFAEPQEVYVLDKDRNPYPQSKDSDANTSGWAKLWDSFKANMFGAGDYVGFRIEKGVSCSESISNSTGQLGIAAKLNSYAAEQRQKYENYGGSWIAKTIGEMATKDPKSMIGTLATEVLSKAASAFGLGDIGAILTNGNGFVDIPEVWQSSSFDRSFTFNLNLFARYGDPVSIFQSIYIPMCMLLCAAMPRSVGNAMYTSPFLVRAFCKGFFSIPCGIITSLSFTRGADEFGWSCNMLPTRVSVSMSIKDMSPTFFMSMQDIGILDTFSRNDKLMEYLDTLSALGIYERMYAFPKAIRKLSAALLIKRNTIFNSDYWGMRLGKSGVTRAMAAVIPYTTIEKSDAEFNAE